MLHDIIITLLGIIAGLMPGIHSNTFAALILLYAASFENTGILIICSAIAYTIADIIPTTLLGVPDEETAIAIFLAHEIVLDGRALKLFPSPPYYPYFPLILAAPLFFTEMTLESPHFSGR